jgi:hypothetical protein
MGSNFKFKVITYIDRVNILSDTFINYYLKFFKPEEFYFLILESEFKNISEYLLNKDFTGEYVILHGTDPTESHIIQRE